ncbi:MAG: bifunctional phosphoribosyl-AMP cyclohydrolase/phosphoribosyl-ATP diphosphatase HisIE [Saprospiraceae bacterium]|nr:bifunctional phosphoribosyl-AMP cyclohydrolase/phosphoribosyl-ATP diphosphatase HisIE [Saprospiraceae bacterium]
MTITAETLDKIDFNKSAGLVPAIIQDATSGRVLMLGYMNDAAVSNTLATGQVTFFSRSKNRLWVKGESSGHYLQLQSMMIDCDADTLLVQATPSGPVCHTGQSTCFGDDFQALSFLGHLEGVVQNRFDHPSGQSYTSSLFKAGLDKIIQKVGEEAIEVVIEAKNDDKDLFLGELADLTFHILVLLRAKGIRLEEVIDVLRKRHQ